MRFLMFLMVMTLLGNAAMAQDDARSVRQASLQASRYELLLGKLQDQNEQLMGQVRALQKATETLAKSVEKANAQAQNVADDMQRMKNTQLQNVSAAQKQINDKIAAMTSEAPWGSGQRDCSEIGVKHQQIKVMMSPQGTKSVRFLCFDGKALLLGSEVYTVDNP